MKNLYDKSKLTFSLVWIAIYVVLLSVADGVSSALSIEKVVTAPLCLALTIYLFVWLKKHDLLCTYGVCAPKCEAKRYLFYLPLLIILSVNFWGGVGTSLNIVEIVLYIISMLCVGFLEEIIFRGFLFTAMKKDNLKAAVIVSSITFGIGHIVNLLSGAEFLPTLLQIIYAAAAGFLFTIMFYKSGSLLFPILVHSLLNATSAFCIQGNMQLQIITACVLTVVSIVYALIILRLNKTNKEQNLEKPVENNLEKNSSDK